MIALNEIMSNKEKFEHKYRLMGKNICLDKIIKLEENYRSTGTVLAAANEVIKNNKGRRGKELWTKNETGDKIIVYKADDEKGEAKFITDKISSLTDDGTSFNDIVILYRMNAQSRVIEDALLHGAIPYRVLENRYSSYVLKKKGNQGFDKLFKTCSEFR